MRAADVVRGTGGRADHTAVLRLVSRHELRRSVAAGELVRVRRGWYCLPDATEPTRVATTCGGVLSHASAAQRHGLSLLSRPSEVEVLLPPGRTTPRRAGVVVRRASLTASERAAGVTDLLRTVLDCAATMPLPSALAVADSALRTGALLQEELVSGAVGRRGTGCAAARRVAALADGRSANAFESALRGHLVAARLTSFQPQHVITGPGFFAQVDLADDERRIALEADGFAVHGMRSAFARDLRRHDELTTMGWLTLRFAWEHVVARPGWVVSQVRSAVMARRRRPRGIRGWGVAGTKAS